MRPGETHFYRLVAVDAAGYRSDPSNPIEVRVGYPQIPKPKPRAVKLAGVSYLVTLQFDAPPAGSGFSRIRTHSVFLRLQSTVIS